MTNSAKLSQLYHSTLKLHQIETYEFKAKQKVYSTKQHDVNDSMNEIL